jgi:hypothetical protein
VVADKIALAFSSPDRFEELLQSGETQSANASAGLFSLSKEDWQIFCDFMTDFGNNWQSYFVSTLYPEYFREHERRGTSHPFRRTKQ